MLHDVAVLMVQTDANVRGWHAEIETQDYVKEVLVYVPRVDREIPLLTGMMRFFWLMVGYFKGYHYIKKHYWQGKRPEVCHVNVLTRAALLPMLLRVVHRVPYIITEHFSRYQRSGSFPHGRLHLWLTRLAVCKAAYVCPVSGNLERAMKRWHLDNPQYVKVGNVVDVDTFSLADMPQNDISRLVHVSWLRDDSKNISGLLRVLRALADERTDWHLDIIGEGNDQERLMALTSELGLDNQVSFYPACSGAALARQLQSHDALVMFSHFENQPVSVLEALSCGLFVIATRVGDIPTMLAEQRGVTVEPGNEAQMLDALRTFVNGCLQRVGQDPALRRSRHQYVAERHTAEHIAQCFNELYNQALHDTRHPL